MKWVHEGNTQRVTRVIVVCLAETEHRTVVGIAEPNNTVTMHQLGPPVSNPRLRLLEIAPGAPGPAAPTHYLWW